MSKILSVRPEMVRSGLTVWYKRGKLNIVQGIVMERSKRRDGQRAWKVRTSENGAEHIVSVLETSMILPDVTRVEIQGYRVE